MANMSSKYKVPQYARNLNKSFKYAAKDVATKSLMPSLSETISTNSEILNKVSQGIRGGRGTTKALMNKLKQNAIYKDMDKIVKNSIDDLKTGNFNNKEREDKMFDEQMGGGFDDFTSDMDGMGSSSDDDGLSFNFDDGGDDGGLEEVDSSTEAQVDATIASAKANIKSNIAAHRGTASIISKSVKGSAIANASMMIEYDREKTARLLAQTEKNHAEVTGHLGNISGNAAKMTEFVSTALAKHIESSSKFMDEVSTPIREMSANIREFTEMQRNMYKFQMAQYEDQERRQKMRDSAYGGIMGGDVFDMGAYGQQIMKNMANMRDASGLGMMSGMGGMTGGSALGMFAGSPLSFIPNMLLMSMIPGVVKKAMGGLDKTFKNLFAGFGGKMNAWSEDDDPIKKAIGELLGAKDLGKSGINTANYFKGVKGFDGITHKTINEVIPRYLAEIAAGVTGRPMSVYDHRTGKFKTMTDIKSDYDSEMNSIMHRSISDYKDEVMMGLAPMLEQIADKQERKDVTDDLDALLKSYVKDGKFFNVKDIKEKEMWELGQDFKSGQEGFDLIRAALGATSYGDRMQFQNEINGYAYEKNKRINEFETHDEYTGYRSLFNGMNDITEKAIKANGSKDDMLTKIYNRLTSGIITYNGGIAPEALIKAAQNPPGGGGSVNKIPNYVNTPLADDPNSKYASLYDLPEGNEIEKYMKEQREKAKRAEHKDPYLQRKFLKSKLGQKIKGTKAGQYMETAANKVGGAIETLDRKTYELIYGKEEGGDGDSDDEADQKNYSDLMKDKMSGFKTNMKSHKDAMMSGFSIKAGFIVPMFNKHIISPLNRALFGESGIFTKAKQSFNDTVLDKGKKYFDIIKTKLFGLDKDGKVDAKSTLGKYGFTPKSFFGTVGGLGASTLLFKTGNPLLGMLGASASFIGGSEKAKSFLFGEVGEDGERKGGKISKGMYKSMKEGVPKGLAGLIGGKLFGSMLFGPLGGLAAPYLAAGIGFASGSETVKEKLFGKMDEKGEREGGLINKDTFKTMKNALPKSLGGFLGGKIFGNMLLGPAGGLLMPYLGAGIGFAAGSDNVKNKLFGEMGEDGQRKGGVISKKHQDLMKKGMPSGLLGGLAGKMALSALFPSFGITAPLVGSLMGFAGGIGVHSDRFKDYMFGKADDNGERDGGVISKERMAKIKKYALPGLGGGAAALGMWSQFGLTGLLAGGALTGLSLSISKHKDTIKEALFGSVDPESGQRVGGAFNRPLMENLKKFAPSGLGGAMLGGLIGSKFGLSGMLLGSLLGSSVGILSASNTLKEKFFGEKADKDIESGDMDKTHTKAFALRGIKLPELKGKGLFGLISESASKVSLDMLSMTDRFRSAIFGSGVKFVKDDKENDSLMGVMKKKIASIKNTSMNKKDKNGMTLLDKMQNHLAGLSLGISIPTITKPGMPDLSKIKEGIANKAALMRGKNHAEFMKPDIDMEEDDRGTYVKKRTSKLNTMKESEKKRLFDIVREGMPKMVGFLRIIKDEVKGQLDGVGWNLNNMNNILEKYLGKADVDPNGKKTGRGNKKRRGIIGKMMDFIAAPFKTIGSLILKPFKKAGDAVLGFGKNIAKAGLSLVKLPFKFAKAIFKVGDLLMEGAKSTLKVVGEVGKQSVKIVGNAIYKTTDALLQLPKHIIGGVSKVIGKTLEGVAGLIKPVAGVAKELAKGMFELSKAVPKVIKGVVDLTATIGKSILNITKGVGNFMLGKIPGMDKVLNKKKEVYITGGTLDRVKVVSGVGGIGKEYISEHGSGINAYKAKLDKKKAEAKKEAANENLAKISENTEGLPELSGGFGAITSLLKKFVLPGLAVGAGGLMTYLAHDTGNTERRNTNAIRTAGIAAKLGANIVKGAGKMVRPVAKMAKAGISPLVNALKKAIFNERILTRIGGKKVANAVMKVIPDILKKFAMGAGKLAGGIATGILPALMVYDFSTGYMEAKRIFKLSPNSKATSKMRISSGLTKMISGLMFGADEIAQAFIDGNSASWIATTIYNAIADVQEEANMKEMQDALKRETETYNAKNGTNLSVGEYNDMVNKGAMSGMSEKFAKAWQKTKDFGNKAKDYAVNAWGRTKDIAKETMDSLKYIGEHVGDYLATKFNDAKDALVKKAGELSEVVKTKFTETKDAVVDKLTYVADTAKEKFGEFKDTVVDFKDQLIEKVKDLPSQIANKFSDSLIKLSDMITDKIAILMDVGGKVKEKYNNFKNTVKEKAGKFWSGQKSVWGELLGQGNKKPSYGAGNVRQPIYGQGKGDTFYSQKDPRWASTPFNTVGDTRKYTISDMGCGPATAAMALSSITGQKLTPEHAAAYALRGGYRSPDDGTNFQFFTDYAASMKIPSRQVDINGQSAIEDVLNSVRKGSRVILMGSSRGNGAGSPFNSTPHYVLLTEIEGDYIYVHDPLKRAGNTKYKISNVFKHATHAIIFNETSNRGAGFAEMYKKLIEMFKSLGSNTSTAGKPFNGRLAWGAKTSSTFNKKVLKVAKNLGVDPNHLMSVMAFESGESFSPTAKNKVSGATGLIQFMPKTAKHLGTTIEDLKKMTAEQQLDYTEKYLSTYKKKISSGKLEDLYASILYPASLFREDGHMFKDPSIEYRQNSGLDVNSDGMVDKFEAAVKVREKLAKGDRYAVQMDSDDVKAFYGAGNKPLFGAGLMKGFDNFYKDVKSKERTSRTINRSLDRLLKTPDTFKKIGYNNRTGDTMGALKGLTKTSSQSTSAISRATKNVKNMGRALGVDIETDGIDKLVKDTRGFTRDVNTTLRKVDSTNRSVDNIQKQTAGVLALTGAATAIDKNKQAKDKQNAEVEARSVVAQEQSAQATKAVAVNQEKANAIATESAQANRAVATTTSAVLEEQRRANAEQSELLRGIYKMLSIIAKNSGGGASNMGDLLGLNGRPDVSGIQSGENVDKIAGAIATGVM